MSDASPFSGTVTLDGAPNNIENFQLSGPSPGAMSAPLAKDVCGHLYHVVIRAHHTNPLIADFTINPVLTAIAPAVAKYSAATASLPAGTIYAPHNKIYPAGARCVRGFHHGQGAGGFVGRKHCAPYFTATTLTLRALTTTQAAAASRCSDKAITRPVTAVTRSRWNAAGRADDGGRASRLTSAQGDGF
jgi:hypothetical protein